LSSPEVAADRERASEARRPGRPASDAPERILNAAYEVLRNDGYVGLTTAKVAAKSGQNKAMISYYFGSKRGLVAATARRVSETLTDRVLAEVDGARTPGELVNAMTDALWEVMDRDPGLQRVYFDLSSHAVVDKEVGGIMLEMKEGHRAIVREVLRGLSVEIAADELDAIAIFIISGLEGLSLERLDRGDSAALRRAREIFIRSAIDAIEAGDTT
jgi:AcrR family transcriptional regulator